MSTFDSQHSRAALGRALTAATLTIGLALIGAPAHAGDGSTESGPAAELLPAITITATRTATRLGDAVARVTVIDRGDIEASPALTVDDLLRRVPGFNLFRRQSSLAANPTTQGVSLRGIAPSGASRTLVLLDGVPLVDPFGGWVYWSRVPTELIERIEIVRGGGSSVWGSGAMGGVINIVTIAPGNVTRLLAEAGNRETANLQSIVGSRLEDGAALFDLSYFTTEGYRILRESDRGAIDRRADSRHGTGGISLQHRLGPRAEARLTARYFEEDRNNGTARTGNETKNAFARASLSYDGSKGSLLQLDAYSQVQRFESDFTAQAEDRNSERPALEQFDVPSTTFGTSTRWSRPLGEAGQLSFGAEYSWIDGKTRENFRNLGDGFTRRRLAGARRHSAGAYAQTIATVADRLTLSAALRIDYWRTYDGRRKERNLEDDSLARDESFDDDDNVLVSPRLGIAFEAAPGLRLRASGYRGFRVPTLNELYRPFRVRNDITEANPGLSEEKLWGAEAGIEYARGPLSASATGYWNRVDDAIANVTVAPGGGVVDPCGFVPDGGVCRQRKNLDETRVLGLELEANRRFGPAQLGVSYLLSDTRIETARADRSIEGNDVPQVPRHQAAAHLLWDFPRGVTAAVELRWVDDQYEDDRNTRELDDYLVVGTTLSKRISSRWQFFIRAENVFDQRFEVAETADGLTTLGAPVFIHAGVRYGR